MKKRKGDKLRRGVKAGGFKVLTEEKITEIHNRVLQVLEKKGVRIECKDALNLLKENGCEIDFEKQTARIPGYLVEESIRKAPSQVRLSGRDRENDIIMELGRSYFGEGCGSMNVLEYGNTLREPKKKDLESAARLGDALLNIDHVWGLYSLPDDPLLGLHELDAVVSNTTKHCCILNWYGKDLIKKQIEMIRLVAGGEKELRKKHLVTLYSEPMSPLIFGKDFTEAIIEWSNYNQPVIWYPAQKPGATSPVTLAGTLIQGFAESLGGNVIVQLNNPGNPFIAGVSPLTMDLRTGMNTYFSAETLLIQSATAQLGEFYRIPIFGTGGCTNSYHLDTQMGAEATLSLYGCVMGGQTLIHDIGMVGAGDAASLELVTACDELIGMMKRMEKGIEVDEETAALDLIESMGYGEDYLRSSHTRKHYKEEHFLPQLLKRVGMEDSKSSENTMMARAHEKKEKLLKEHEVEPLPEDVKKRIEEIIEESKKLVR
jgi:trimethylamine--corrinoid protein Co-methyltransferase